MIHREAPLLAANGHAPGGLVDRLTVERDAARRDLLESESARAQAVRERTELPAVPWILRNQK